MKTIPVAAVYDRRNETIPAVIDSRYRAAVYDRRNGAHLGAHRAPLQQKSLLT